MYSLSNYRYCFNAITLTIYSYYSVVFYFFFFYSINTSKISYAAYNRRIIIFTLNTGFRIKKRNVCIVSHRKFKPSNEIVQCTAMRLSLPTYTNLNRFQIIAYLYKCMNANHRKRLVLKKKKKNQFRIYFHNILGEYAILEKTTEFFFYNNINNTRTLHNLIINKNVLRLL